MFNQPHQTCSINWLSKLMLSGTLHDTKIQHNNTNIICRIGVYCYILLLLYSGQINDDYDDIYYKHSMPSEARPSLTMI